MIKQIAPDLTEFFNICDNTGEGSVVFLEKVFYEDNCDG